MHNHYVKIFEKGDKVAVGKFTLYFFRTRLNKAYIANVSFGHLSVVQSFIFSKKITSDFSFLISQETTSDILGEREDMLSVPKCTVQFLRLCRVEPFLRFCLHQHFFIGKMSSETWVLLTSSFFHQKSANFAISKNAATDCILIHNF